jgi:ATP-dependent helicase/nuclease subunit B
MVHPELNNHRHVFLGWESPPIELLTSWLTSQYTRGPNLDLSDTIIVLPAATAVKSLLGRLIDHCQSTQRLFFPPTAVTLGHLPEYLYSARPAASTSLQALLWTDVARKAAANNALECVFPAAPQFEDFAPWHAIGETLATLHTELAGDMHDFHSVVEYCQRSGHANEVQRWQQLAGLQRAYLDAVDQLGFWDIQTARMIAVKQTECSTDKEILVAGCVDINQTIQGMLNQIADSLTIVTFAPSSESDRFQNNGSLNTDTWHQQPVELPSQQLNMVESPEAQALACANVVAEYSATGSSQQDFVIACPDAGDEPYILRLFDRQSTPVSRLRGRSLDDNIVVTTLRLLGNYVQTKSYRSFSSLLRLPDIQQYLVTAGIVGDLISLSDDFHEKHLPRHTDRLRGLKGKYERLAGALDSLDTLVLPLSSGSSRLSHWCAAILETLNGVYGQRLVEVNDPRDTAVLCGTRSVSQSLAHLADADRSFHVKCEVNECIDLALELASNQFETIQLSAGVTITGWLDVVWGEQSNVLITGFNEGTIPSSITSDLFLPNTLRSSLGLVDNARRFARDAYTTTLLINSRATVTFFCKRTDAAGMPLWPSRIALTADAPQIANRLLDFSAASSETTTITALYNVASSPSTNVDIPFADVNRAEFAVTEFRDYLSCPTRYYLKHILEIAATVDDSRELSALAFGNLLHDTLNDFGMSELSRSTDSDAIYEYLESQLQSRSVKLYGEYSYGVIPIQISQLCNRLRAFSIWQAAWIADGWEIVETEFNCSPGVPISEDHPNLIVRGRIDRIDYHAETSSWSIFDYKSSEACHRPEKIHNCNDAPYWKDLQLPLYRHLAKSVTGSASVQLGYINICNDSQTIGGYFAEWDAHQLDTADLVALQVMQAINSNQFEMRNETKPAFFNDFSYLLGDTILDNPAPNIERESIE